jgi:hypothetical protein
VTQDALRAVLDSVFAAPEYRWVERRNPLAFVARWLEGLQRWLVALRDAHPLGFRLLLAALVVVLVATLVHAGWILSHALRAEQASHAASGSPATRKDRSWYRRESDRLAAEGRYAEAMQAEFLALVLALDGLQLLRFHPGKTPAEYAHDARLGAAARAEFRDLVRSLYGYAFARWPCGPDDFAHWRSRAEPERYARA